MFVFKNRIFLNKLRLCFCIFSCSVFILLNAFCCAKEDGINNIYVTLDSEGTFLPLVVQNRIKETVMVIAEKILIGSKVKNIEEGRLQDEKLLKEVFNRALLGFFVEKVNIQIHENNEAEIVLKIRFIGNLIEKTTVLVDFYGVDPSFAELFLLHKQVLQKKVEEITLFLPVDAMDWANSLIKSMIKDYFTLNLPDYQEKVEVFPDKETKVVITAMPVGEQVRSVQVKLKTKSFPNVILYDFRSQLEDIAQKINGLPVHFLVLNKVFFDKWLLERSLENSIAQKWGLKIKVDLEAQRDTTVFIETIAEKYNIYAEGYFDFGKEKDNVSGKLHLGKFFSKKEEIFTEVQFVPTTLKWHALLGIAHKLDYTTLVAVKYDFTKKSVILWLHYDLSKRWKFEMDRLLVDQTNEFRLRYMLHDYGGLEYVINNKENFLRFVAVF